MAGSVSVAVSTVMSCSLMPIEDSTTKLLAGTVKLYTPSAGATRPEAAIMVPSVGRALSVNR